MQKYLLTVLINEKVSEAGRNEIFAGFKKFGTLEKEDFWGMRSLSYPIKHAGRAFYAHFDFLGEPQSIIDLDKSIRLNEDIIRYLIVKAKIVKKIKVSKKSEPKELESEEKVSEAPVQAVEETEEKEQKRKKIIVKVTKEKK